MGRFYKKKIHLTLVQNLFNSLFKAPSSLTNKAKKDKKGQKVTKKKKKA